MGNSLANCFHNSTNNNELTSNGHSYDEVKITKVQAAVRRKLTSNAVANEKIEILSQNFDEEFIGVDGDYVDLNLLLQRRGEILLARERDFKETNKISFVDLSPYKKEHLCFNKPPVLLKDNSIYEGLWTKNNEGNYVRHCHGSLYMPDDGTKIEGIWIDGTISLDSDTIVYYPDGVIYIGIVDKDFRPNGKGTLHYPVGKVITTTWEEGQPEGPCVITVLNLLSVQSSYTKGRLNYKSGTISYPNGTIYKGQFKSFNNKIHRHGNGIATYINGNSYEGNWSKDKFHGQGVFTFNEITQEIEDEILLPTTSPGAKIKATWINGVLNGEGVIITKENIGINCIWRFGKLIYSVEKLVHNKIILNHRIFEYVTLEDLVEISKIKNRNILAYLKKNSYENLNRMRINQILLYDNKFYDNESENKALHQILQSGKSSSKVFHSFVRKLNEFIPYVGYECNGGYLEKRFHYSNLFNPRKDNAYSSNYLGGPLSDIEVKGGFKRQFYNLKHKETTSTESNGSLLVQVGKILNEDQDYIEFDRENVDEYIPLYDQELSSYDINYHNLLLNDLNVLEDDESRYICCIHQVVITIPIKLSLYTVLYNPVRTLAIYTKDDGNNSNEDQYKVSKEYLHDYSTSLENSFRGILNILKVTHTDTYDAIEFDTVTQEHYRHKLLALITIKDYDNPVIVNFKRYHHTGNNILIRLIDQNVKYDAKKVGMEVGSICFYGEVFQL